MRNIKEFAGSTPTYVYNISDAASVGMDLEKMSIGMSIQLGDATYYVLPDIVIPEIFDFSDVQADRVWRNDNYCRHVANSNQFIITPPLWRIPRNNTETEGIYQIFLYMLIPHSLIVTDHTGDIVTERPAVFNPLNVIIDYGGFVLLDRIAPPLSLPEKRGGNLAFI